MGGLSEAGILNPKLPVRLSPLAGFKLKQILYWIEHQWGNPSKQKFLIELDKSFERIAQFPLSAQEFEGFPGLRRCVVTKQTSFIYQEAKEQIQIVTVFDNRRNPSEIKREIETFFGMS